VIPQPPKPPWRAEPTQPLGLAHLGTVPYAAASQLQESLRERRLAGLIGDLLLYLEHPPTYTLGRRAKEGELPLPAAFYRERGIELFQTNRGGRITYHGPGQLVGYGIFAVKDVVAYVRALEQAIVVALGRYGLPARARPHDGPAYTGVWVGSRKIASIGVHVRRGVTIHGFALNVTNDLEPFRWIVPCGLSDVEMTSFAKEVGLPLEEGLHRNLARAIAQELAGGAPLKEIPEATLSAQALEVAA